MGPLVPLKNIGVLRVCCLCGAQIVFCLPCNRGQRYCRSGCSQLARKRSRARSRARYLRTDQGKARNSQHQAVHRARRRKLSVSDQPSLFFTEPLDTSAAEVSNVAALLTETEGTRRDEPNEAKQVVAPVAKGKACECCGTLVTHYVLDESLNVLRRRRRRKCTELTSKPISGDFFMSNI